MATDFTDCGFGAITPELILRSLIGCVDTLAISDIKALRIEINQEVAALSAVHCANYEDFQLNLKRCLTIANDGVIALRVNFVSGSISSCPDCGIVTSWFESLNSLFTEDSHGVVYLNIFPTNSNPN